MNHALVITCFLFLVVAGAAAADISDCCAGKATFNIPVGAPTTQTCVGDLQENESYLVNKTWITESCCSNETDVKCCYCTQSIIESCLYGCENVTGCKDSTLLVGVDNKEKTAFMAWAIFVLMIFSGIALTSVQSWTQKSIAFVITLASSLFVIAIHSFPLNLIGAAVAILSSIYILALVEGAKRNE